MNGKLTAAIGGLVLAAAALFGFLNGVPWPAKSEVESIKTAIGEIQKDVREIRVFLLGDRRREGGRR